MDCGARKQSRYGEDHNRPRRQGIRAYLLAVHAFTAFLGICGIDSYAQSEVPFYSKAQLTAAIAVQAASQQTLLASDGVRGVGIGQKDQGLAIIVLVDDTNRQAQLPTTLNNLPVSVQAVGVFQALVCGGSNSQASYTLPVPLGVSGGNALLGGSPSSCGSGTIGFKVRDNTTGFIGWISNNHVVGHGNDGCPNTAPVGTPQYQPGPVDTSCNPAQLIGTLNRVVPIIFGGANNLVDAGLVLSSDVDVSSDILNLGPQVDNVVPAFVGQVVRKNGRTTGCTEGTVTAVNLTTTIDYGGTCGTATFTNQIMVSPTAPSTAFGAAGDSGSPIVDANNNAVALLFGGDPTTGIASGNPMAAVLAALNVSLSSITSSQVVTRTSRFWFTHGYGSETNCATLLKAITTNGGILDLGFVTLATENRNSDNVIDGTDAFIEALGFFWRSTGRTGEDRGTQSAKLKATSLCTARKQLAVELIAASANTGLLGTFPPNATYLNGNTVTNFPADLLSRARSAGAGGDVTAVRSMTALLKKFNGSGVTNDLPNGLVECSSQSAKILKPISRDPMIKSTCPGINDTCESALPLVSFPFSQSVNLTAYGNNLSSPSCAGGGRAAVWSVAPPVAVAGRQFFVRTTGSNFDTVISVRQGGCNATNQIAEVSCVDQVLGVGGEQLLFTADGTNPYFIIVEGKNGAFGKAKVTVTSF
jgi:hypothetical protein